MKTHTLIAEQTTVIIDEVGYKYKHFYVGSIESYAAKHNDDPKKALRDNAKKAKAMPYQNYCIAWISPHCSVIDNTGRSAAEYKRREDEAVRVRFGDRVIIEGREYTVVKAFNQNVSLIPVNGGVFGHKDKPLYSC